MRWPSRLTASQEISGLSHSVDIVPTLTDLAGLTAPSALPGKSLKPLLTVSSSASAHQGGQSQESEPVQGQAPASSVHSHVLTAYSASSRPKAGSGSPARQVRTIFDGRYKYSLYFDSNAHDNHELYDLDSDPYEMTNLANNRKYASLQSQMSALLTQARHQEMGESS
jgi:arylsulfatase A-like enzyme